MNGALRVVGYDPVHKVQKLAAPPAGIMARLHFSGNDMQGGKKGGGTVALVAVTKTVHRFAIGEPEKALRAFQHFEYAASRQPTTPKRVPEDRDRSPRHRPLWAQTR